VHTFLGDVRSEEDVLAAIAATEEIGPLRVVASCAGIGPPGRLVRRSGDPIDLSIVSDIIGVNLLGTLNVVRLAAAAMAPLPPVGEERGVIIMTASIAAFDGQIGQVAYAASKAGIAGSTLPIARELADSLIRVVSIAPGSFDTPLFETVSPELRQTLADAVPHPRRLGDPGEFASLAMHIVDNPMLNGEVIRLDGALRMSAR
jgi:NAD(P)-dependent dehydrogenase (short-subunit alcohol dehydrogenase family)